MRRLRRLNLSLDLAVIALAYSAFALVVAPVLFKDYCTDGPRLTTVAAEFLHELRTWHLVGVVLVAALIELRWTLRTWVVRTIRWAALLWLAFLLFAPWSYLRAVKAEWLREIPGPMQTYWSPRPLCNQYQR